MKNEQVAKILKDHNDWRRSTEDYFQEMPHSPRELSLAIDLAVIELKYSLRISDVVDVVDSMSDFDTEEERDLFMKELRTNLGAL